MAQNLKAAMAMEKVYRKLQDNWQAKTAFGYHDKLKKFGFADTVEYERAKAEHYLKNGGIKAVMSTSETVMADIAHALTSQVSTMIIADRGKPCAYNGRNNPINEDYCKVNDIPIFTVERGGGVIVTSPDDLGCNLVCESHSLLPILMERFHAYVSARCGDRQCVIDKNDILIDGYKVMAFAQSTIGKMYMYNMQFSFKVNLEHIRNITMKEIVKIPGELSKLSSVNKQELAEEVLSWLQ